MLRQCYSYQGRHVYWKKRKGFIDFISSAINTMDQRTWSALTMGQVTCRAEQYMEAYGFDYYAPSLMSYIFQYLMPVHYIEI